MKTINELFELARQEAVTPEDLGCTEQEAGLIRDGFDPEWFANFVRVECLANRHPSKIRARAIEIANGLSKLVGCPQCSGPLAAIPAYEGEGLVYLCQHCETTFKGDEL